MKCLFPVKHTPLNILPICKSAVEEQWNAIPNTTLKPNHNDQCSVHRSNGCCYQSEMINNAEKASRVYPCESQAQIWSSKTGPLACPIEPSDNETGPQPQLWVTPVPKPTTQVTATAFLLPEGSLQFQKGTESNRKQLVWQNLEKKPRVRI